MSTSCVPFSHKLYGNTSMTRKPSCTNFSVVYVIIMCHTCYVNEFVLLKLDFIGPVKTGI
jgi:hypothetical protein